MMEIFIGSMPKGATVAELLRLFQQAIQKNVFRRLSGVLIQRFNEGQVANFRILEKKHRKGVVRYGYITIEDARLARFFIETIHGEELRGQILEAREFMHREYSGDRRARHSLPHNWVGDERRHDERRIVEKRRRGAV